MTARGKCKVDGCNVTGEDSVHIVQTDGSSKFYRLCGSVEVLNTHLGRWDRRVDTIAAAMKKSGGKAKYEQRVRVAFRDFMIEMGLEIQRAKERE